MTMGPERKHHDIPPNCGIKLSGRGHRLCTRAGIVTLADGRRVCGTHAKMIADGRR